MKSTSKVIEPIPVIIISGFLGSGKTSLINRLLPHYPRSALIINEFGSTGIDQQLIQPHHIPVSTLIGGCLCCQVRDALVPMLRNLRMAWEEKADKPFDRIIIETSGVANPEPVLESLFGHHWLKQRYSLQGMITTVSATHQDIFNCFPEATTQLSWADTVVLTHTDIASISQIKTVQQQIQYFAPSSLKINATHDAILPNLLTTFNNAPHYVNQAYVEPISKHPFHSISLQLEPVVNYQRFHTILTHLMAQYAQQLVRLKGIVYSHQQAEPFIVQAANGVIYPIITLQAKAPKDGMGRLVLITHGKVDGLAEELMAQLQG